MKTLVGSAAIFWMIGASWHGIVADSGPFEKGAGYLHPFPPPLYLNPSGSRRECGGYPNDTHGHINTPRFPLKFPVPISCKWVFHIPLGKKIVLYFTQFYMRESFQLTEYDLYTDKGETLGRHELGTVSFEDKVTSFTVYKPYLVLKFRVSKKFFLHLLSFCVMLCYLLPQLKWLPIQPNDKPRLFPNVPALVGLTSPLQPNYKELQSKFVAVAMAACLMFVRLSPWQSGNCESVSEGSRQFVVWRMPLKV